MARAKLLRLMGNAAAKLMHQRIHLVATVSGDNRDRATMDCKQRIRCRNDMRQYRLAGERVKYLREVGAHPATFPGSQDDNIKHGACAAVR